MQWDEVVGKRSLLPATDAYELLRSKATPAILHHGILATTQTTG